MPRTFLTPPIELLSAEGRFVGLAHEAAAAADHPRGARALQLRVVRVRCERRGGGRGRAAYARANAPYLNPGADGAAGGARLRRLVVGRRQRRTATRRPLRRRAPAALAPGLWRSFARRPVADRLRPDERVRAADLANVRALVASSWRRAQPYRGGLVCAFTRLQRDPPVPPPTAPPAPETLPIAEGFTPTAFELELTPASHRAKLAAGSAAALLALSAAFLDGAGLAARWRGDPP